MTAGGGLLSDGRATGTQPTVRRGGGRPPTGLSAGLPAGWSAEVCRSAEEFGRLGPEWAALHGRCTPATPFQTHAWLHSWWLSYGLPGRLRVVLVRGGDGRLVGAAPLMRVLSPVPALVPLGGPISDFSDVLLDDGCATEAAPVLASAMLEAAGATVVDFREVRPGAALERVRACWRGPQRESSDSLCLELPGVPMDDLVARLPSSRAQRARSKLRKIAALGLQRRVVRPEEVDRALGDLLALHRLQWQGRKVTPEHLRPRFHAHLSRAVTAMAARGEAAVTEFRLDGTLVASDLTLLSPRMAGGYLYGAHPLLRERKADVTTMLLHSGTEHLGAAAADGSGAAVLSLLRGKEPYKNHWRPEPVLNRRFLLAGRQGAPLLAATAFEAAARARARELLRARRERHGAGA